MTEVLFLWVLGLVVLFCVKPFVSFLVRPEALFLFVAIVGVKWVCVCMELMGGLGPSFELSLLLELYHVCWIFLLQVWEKWVLMVVSGQGAIIYLLYYIQLLSVGNATGYP